MTSDVENPADREGQLCEVLAAYFEAAQAGRAPEREVWLARHPDLAGELAAFLQEQDRLLRMTEPLRSIVEEIQDLERGPGHDLLEAVGDLPGRPTTSAPVIGDYVLLDEIDRGGVGVVYRARQRGLNRDVALKMLRAGVLADSDDRRRFRFEAEAVARLDHPNIVPVHEVGNHDGFSYLAMKLVEGSSLARRVGDYADDPKAAARLVAAVARAIHHAHQRGILHRDLKPSNILVDAQGQPHVTDFGLARRVAGDSDLTRSGDVVGTAPYMAPEQATGRRGSTTVATDVYGLGAVLYALLSGRPPFQADSPLETLDQVRQKAPEPPGRNGRSVDLDPATICLKCLEKEPERRYPSALALAEDLERWLRGEPIAARPVGRLGRAWRWYRRNPVVAGLTSLVVTLLVAGVVGLALGNRLLAGQRDAARQQSRRAERALAEARLQRQRAAYNFGQILERLTFLVKELRAPNPGESPEALALRRAMTDRVIDFLRTAADERADEPTMRLEAVYALTNLGKIHDWLGEFAEADHAFARAIAQAERLAADYPAESAYRVHLGHLHENMGQRCVRAGRPEDGFEEFLEGERHFRQAVAVGPDHPNALNFLAWQLVACPIERLRNPDEAIVWARRGIAAAQGPDRGRIWNTLGVAYYRKGQWKRAIEAQEMASRLRPGGPTDDEFFILAMSYWHLGDRALAERYYDRAMEWSRARMETPAVQNFYDEATRLLGRPGSGPARP
jgi:tetratricopeptide (TPR) repeat protein